MPVKSQTAQFLTFFFPCPEQVSRLTPARLCSGAERARTANLLVANQALSQLSYGPSVAFSFQHSAFSHIMGPTAADC